MNKKQVNVEKIIELYQNNLSLVNIAKECGFKSYGPITRVLKENNVTIKKRGSGNSRIHNLDENFFDNIDTPEKAYILGWIISDGYVNDYKLTFCVKDLEILEKFKIILKSGHKISDSIYYDKRTKKHYQRYMLQITSKKLVTSLNKLGIKQAKSFDVDLPDIPKNLYPHLIRGIFDGDGYIGMSTGKTGNIIPRFSIIVSENLYNKLEPIFNELDIKFMSPEIIAEQNGNRILKIRVYRKNELTKFFKFIYGDGNVTKLDRKYNKFKDLF